MTAFRRFLSLASATVFAASLALASELTWDFNFAPSDVSLSSVGEYTLVSLADGSNPRDAIGAPAIPAKFANILLPDGATDVSVAATGDLVLLASDITPYPVQRVAPKSKPMPPFTAPDPVAYASAAPWPSAIATCEGLHDMQGSTFVSVRVNPLVYVASEKALYYRPTVSVSVSYTAPSAAPRSSRSVSQNALATEMVNALVVNPEAADSPSAVRRRAASRASTVDYLIITSSGLSSAFQNLADYRASAAGGAFKTLVVTTNDIASSYSGDDIQMKIRNCISNYVKNSGTTYVVLGGDDKIVPDRDCYAAVTSQDSYEWHMPTDLYYSDLTGTWKASGNTNFGVRAANVDMSPDVIVGRIPVRTAAQLSGYLAKVQAFEADTSHTRNSIIMGGPAAWCRYYGNKRPSDDVTGDGHAGFRASNRPGYVSDSEMWNRRLFRDGIKPYWQSAESSITMKIACDSITSWDSSTCGDKALSSSNLKTWLNVGYTHFMFSGHGYPQGWGMETSGNYSSTQAAAQTNLVAFVYTDACLTGAFDEDGIGSSGSITVDVSTDPYQYTSEPCLGEAFIRNANGGSLVHMGCARYGWGSPDYQNSDPEDEDSDGYYTNCTATATSDGGPSTVYAYKFYKRLYESAALSSNRTVGAAFAMSKADMISQCKTDDCERWIQFGLNYLGDPAITLYPRVIPDAAPEFSSSTASEATFVGEEILFDFADLLSAGYPAPTFSIVSSASASTYEIADSLISFTPAATGTYTFTCTAANSSGTATCTLTVTVTEPPPATPEVPSTPPAAATTSFTASWSAVADAASYKLYVQQKVAPATSARAARDASTILTESFENDIPASWTKSSNVATATGKGGDGDTCVAFKGAGAYLITEALDNPTGVSLMYKRSSNTAAWGLDISVGPSADGPWTSVGTISSADTTWNTYETTFTASGTVYLKFTDTRASGAAERYVDLIQVTGSSDTWVDIPGSPFTVSATSKTVSGLSADTEYRYSVTAVNAAGVESEPSSYVPVTTAAGDSAPSISVEQTSYSVTVGAPDVDFTVTVTGSPAPTVTATCTEGAYFVFEDNEFLFEPATVGTYHFVFTATNSEGSDSETVTIVVSAAPVTVPTLLVGDETATTAYATWDECTGVSSYTLQLASDDQFTTGGGSGGGESVELVNEGFDGGTTLPTGWTVESGSIGGTYTSGGNYGVSSPSLQLKSSVTFSTPALSNPTNVSFWYKGNGSSFTSTLVVEQLVGGTWSEVDTAAISGSADTFSHALDSSATQVRFVFTKNSGNVAFDDVVITGTSGSSGSSGEGSLILETTVADTEYTFTGLTPFTVYYARVKGNADWSNVAEFITEEETVTDTAPSWKATFPATATVNVGEFYTLANVSSYASGSPAPTITMAGPAGVEAELAGDTFTFAAEASGDYTFTFTAANGISPDATATLVVTAVGQAPVLTASQGTAVAAVVGDTVEFTVTATGIPAPTVAMVATEYDAIFENGEFAFAPDAVGTYDFTFTASNAEGTDTLTVTVTVTAAPVTIPELAVTNITDTTALATWTACDGVTSYTLQLSTNDFTAASGASRSATPILSEDFSGVSGTSAIADFDSVMQTSGWSGEKVYAATNAVRLGTSSAAGSFQTPALTSIGSTVRVVWSSFRWPNDGETAHVGISVDGGETFTDQSVTLTDDWQIYTNTFEVSASSAIIRWSTVGSSKKRFYIDDIAITTFGGDTPAGDDVQEFTVPGTSYEFTGLTPFTVYYARVKGNSYWSNTEEFITDEAAGSAPVVTVPQTSYSVTVGDPDVNFTVTATGTPAPTVTATCTEGAYFVFENNEFLFEPATAGTYHFVFTATNSEGSDSETVTVTVTGAAPVITVPQTSYAVTVGDPDVDFTVTATGAPVPTVTATCTEGAYFVFENNEFLFEPATVGTYHFVFTATNSEGSDTETVTIVVSAAPITVPVLTVTNITDTTALATWTACDGVTEYTLQLSTNDFAAASGASRSATPILSEDFAGFTGNGTTDISASLDNYTATAGWTGSKVYCNNGEAKVGASSGQPWLMTPAIAASGTLRVVWTARRYGTGDQGTLLLGVSENGTDFVDETITLADEMTTYTNEFALAGSTAYVRWMGSGSSKARFYLDDVTVTNPGGGDTPAGDDVQEFTVPGTSYEFTGLTPFTVYYARVKGNADWSDTEEFITEEAPAPGIAPAWSAAFPATATVNVGEFYTLDNVSSYASGSPAPTITMAGPAGVEAELADDTFTFAAEASGDYTFTFTAANGISPDATATLIVTAVGQAPVLTASQGTAIAAVVGDDVEFTVTATGIPAPTVTMAATEYDAVFENGEFLFAPTAVGTYAFTFTASNTEGTDTLTVTVTVTGGSGALETYVEWLERSGLDTTIPATAIADDGKTYQWHYVTDTIPGSGQEPGIVITDASSGTFTVSALSEFRYYQLVYTTDLTQPRENDTTVDLGWGEDVGMKPFPVDGNWFGRIRVLLDEPQP